MNIQKRSSSMMRRQTVAEALADKSPHLFVMNRVKPEGNINMNALGDDGVMTAIVIPTTFIPLDMTLFISRENLLKNMVFRRLEAGGKIAIINPEDAINAIANEPRAQKELDRILNVNSEHGGRHNQQNHEELIELKATKNGSGDTNLAPLQNINPFAIGIVQRATSEDVADLIADIESRGHTLDVTDLEYIAQNVEDNTLKQFVVDYASSN